jgi:glycerol uptake facilitator-like aquaporin
MEKNPATYLKHCIVELLGTFFLLSAIFAAPAGMAPIAAGGILLVMVASIGNLSGAHLNPAVTTALVASRQFAAKDALGYVIAQTFGALLAITVTEGLGRDVGPVQRGGSAILAEFVGVFLLTFVVSRMVLSKAGDAPTALGIGLALGLGVMIAAPFSGGVLNPAIGLALLITGKVAGALGGIIPYLLVPLIAGLLAGPLARYLTFTAR